MMDFTHHTPPTSWALLKLLPVLLCSGGGEGRVDKQRWKSLVWECFCKRRACSLLIRGSQGHRSWMGFVVNSKPGAAGRNLVIPAKAWWETWWKTDTQKYSIDFPVPPPPSSVSLWSQVKHGGFRNSVDNLFLDTVYVYILHVSRT